MQKINLFLLSLILVIGSGTANTQNSENDFTFVIESRGQINTTYTKSLYQTI